MESGCVDKKRLNDAECVHVVNAALLDIDTGVSLTGTMSFAELGDDVDRIKPRVFGKGVWDNLERIGEGT
jgi:hypothetical protein